MSKTWSTWRWTDFPPLSRLRWNASAGLFLFWAEGHRVSSPVGFHGLSFRSREWCSTMPNLQSFLEDFDQADLLHRGLQGLRWKLNTCALWKKSIPVRQDLLVMDLELRLLAWILILNNGKRLSLKGTRKKSIQPGTNWLSQCCDCMVFFSFHWNFWLLHKKRFQHGWKFCRLHDFKCDWNFPLLPPR